MCRQEESNRPLCKGGKKVVLSSASLQSPLLQALLLRGGGVKGFLSPLLFSRARGGAGLCKRSWLT